jgi:hypothetical protein
MPCLHLVRTWPHRSKSRLLVYMSGLCLALMLSAASNPCWIYPKVEAQRSIHIQIVWWELPLNFKQASVNKGCTATNNILKRLNVDMFVSFHLIFVQTNR